MVLSALWFLLAALLFYFSIRKPPGYLRYSLGALHIFCMISSLIVDCFIPSPYSETWMLFVIATILHAFAILFTQRKVVYDPSKRLKDNLRDTFWIWSNLRQISFTKRVATPDTKNGVITARTLFALTKSFRILTLWFMNRFISWLTLASFVRLQINIEDFAPEKQGLLPPMTPRDLSLRIVISSYWISSNYFTVNLAYDIFSVLFVSILQWDMPSDWTYAFGSVSEAYTLRRFWGVFWHKFHVEVITAYTPSYFCWKEDECWKRSVRNNLRALWIFLVSGVCHGLVNLALQRDSMRQDIRFFLSNYIICLVETVVKSFIWKRSSHSVASSLWLRLLGYVWVLCFFVCTVPAWKYPLVYTSVIA
ncbi:uncharacterized protein GGS22DRAFT_190424 [Annulohypoxylon maeteangense]|uniref:uncharacterized protein n=1 Tax=Annulohypoxylon maeteangense TaxID=1927788 RepID=UPI002008A8A6|nr:uncharacterized protein GGS22DRAFT_190424 [Annulohypoxylon maeteangense]KAI0883117.1 hypothetical protein GGS22DRAFT_190424 [Annulohypoxylon maeteangense]